MCANIIDSICSIIASHAVSYCTRYTGIAAVVAWSTDGWARNSILVVSVCAYASAIGSVEYPILGAQVTAATCSIVDASVTIIQA